MAIPFPQVDLPSGVRGGSALDDESPAGGVLAGEFFVAAPTGTDVAGADTAAAAAESTAAAAAGTGSANAATTGDAQAGVHTLGAGGAESGAAAVVADAVHTLGVSALVAAGAAAAVQAVHARPGDWGGGGWGQGAWGGAPGAQEQSSATDAVDARLITVGGAAGGALGVDTAGAQQAMGANAGATATTEATHTASATAGGLLGETTSAGAIGDAFVGARGSVADTAGAGDVAAATVVAGIVTISAVEQGVGSAQAAGSWGSTVACAEAVAGTGAGAAVRGVLSSAETDVWAGADTDASAGGAPAVVESAGVAEYADGVAPVFGSVLEVCFGATGGFATQAPDWGPAGSEGGGGWVGVGDAQSAAWSVVVDAQAGSWQNAASSPGGAWVDVDDSNSPAWA